MGSERHRHGITFINRHVPTNAPQSAAGTHSALELSGSSFCVHWVNVLVLYIHVITIYFFAFLYNIFLWYLLLSYPQCLILERTHCSLLSHSHSNLNLSFFHICHSLSNQYKFFFFFPTHTFHTIFQLMLASTASIHHRFLHVFWPNGTVTTFLPICFNTPAISQSLQGHV